MHRQDDSPENQQQPGSNYSDNQVATNNHLIESIITAIAKEKPLSAEVKEAMTDFFTYKLNREETDITTERALTDKLINAALLVSRHFTSPENLDANAQIKSEVKSIVENYNIIKPYKNHIAKLKMQIPEIEKLNTAYKLNFHPTPPEEQLFIAQNKIKIAALKVKIADVEMKINSLYLPLQKNKFFPINTPSIQMLENKDSSPIINKRVAALNEMKETKENYEELKTDFLKNGDQDVEKINKNLSSFLKTSIKLDSSIHPEIKEALIDFFTYLANHRKNYIRQMGKNEFAITKNLLFLSEEYEIFIKGLKNVANGKEGDTETEKLIKRDTSYIILNYREIKKVRDDIAKAEKKIAEIKNSSEYKLLTSKVYTELTLAEQIDLAKHQIKISQLNYNIAEHRVSIEDLYVKNHQHLRLLKLYPVEMSFTQAKLRLAEDKSDLEDDKKAYAMLLAKLAPPKKSTPILEDKKSVEKTPATLPKVAETKTLDQAALKKIRAHNKQIVEKDPRYLKALAAIRDADAIHMHAKTQTIEALAEVNAAKVIAETTPAAPKKSKKAVKAALKTDPIQNIKIAKANHKLKIYEEKLSHLRHQFQQQQIIIISNIIIQEQTDSPFLQVIKKEYQDKAKIAEDLQKDLTPKIEEMEKEVEKVETSFEEAEEVASQTLLRNKEVELKKQLETQEERRKKLDEEKKAIELKNKERMAARNLRKKEKRKAQKTKKAQENEESIEIAKESQVVEESKLIRVEDEAAPANEHSSIEEKLEISNIDKTEEWAKLMLTHYKKIAGLLSMPRRFSFHDKDSEGYLELYHHARRFFVAFYRYTNGGYNSQAGPCLDNLSKAIVKSIRDTVAHAALTGDPRIVVNSAYMLILQMPNYLHRMTHPVTGAAAFSKEDLAGIIFTEEKGSDKPSPPIFSDLPLYTEYKDTPKPRAMKKSEIAQNTLRQLIIMDNPGIKLNKFSLQTIYARCGEPVRLGSLYRRLEKRSVEKDYRQYNDLCQFLIRCKEHRNLLEHEPDDGLINVRAILELANNIDRRWLSAEIKPINSSPRFFAEPKKPMRKEEKHSTATEDLAQQQATAENANLPSASTLGSAPTPAAVPVPTNSSRRIK